MLTASRIKSSDNKLQKSENIPDWHQVNFYVYGLSQDCPYSHDVFLSSKDVWDICIDFF